MEVVEIENISIPLIKGEKGDTGNAGKILSLSVTMLASTATPTVTNTGTQTEAKYELGIPRGTSVTSALINEDGELVFTLSDSTTLNLGVIMPNSIASVSMNEDYDFIVTLTDGTETTVGNIADEIQDLIDTALADYYDKDTADSLFALIDETGNKIDLSINSTTYVVTLKLKDKNNNVLSTGTIDLPLESVVVSGAYDSTNKKVVLTLQNGSTIEFSVADLISGLQSEITVNNKLDADLVDDTNSTNKFTNATEKSGWNAKYNKPSGGIPSTDLASAVQTSLGKADTALQSTDIVSSVSSSSTNSKAVGAKLFYDTIGDIESILETLDTGSGV